jgi:Glutamate synthase central domain.
VTKIFSEKRANIPMALAVGAINSNLVNLGLRGYCSINAETSETLETHSVCSF